VSVEALSAVAEKALTVWWVFTHPLYWLVVLIAFWVAGRNEREMREKDIEEWNRTNGR